MIDAIIDLSHHNSSVDFEKIKAAGVLGVTHKASQGLTEVDPLYLKRANAAKDAGLMWGAYHFGTGADGTAQAEHFLSVASDASLMVLDFEENREYRDSPMTLSQAYDFINLIKQRTGRWPGLYGGDYLLELLKGKPDAMLQNCWLWLADYKSNWGRLARLAQDRPIDVMPGWPQWNIWQHTDAGRVDGIAGYVDRSYFNGTAEELAGFWAGKPVTA